MEGAGEHYFICFFYKSHAQQKKGTTTYGVIIGAVHMCHKTIQRLLDGIRSGGASQLYWYSCSLVTMVPGN